MALYFYKFKLEYHTNCIYDFLEMRILFSLFSYLHFQRIPSVILIVVCRPHIHLVCFILLIVFVYQRGSFLLNCINITPVTFLHRYCMNIITLKHSHFSFNYYFYSKH